MQKHVEYVAPICVYTIRGWAASRSAGFAQARRKGTPQRVLRLTGRVGRGLGIERDVRRRRSVFLRTHDTLRLVQHVSDYGARLRRCSLRAVFGRRRLQAANVSEVVG